MAARILRGLSLVEPESDKPVSLHDHRTHRHFSLLLSPFTEADTQIHPVAVSRSGVISRQELHLRVR